MAAGSPNRLRAGQIGSTKIRLARGRDRPYVRRRVKILPDRQDVPGDPGKILLDPDRRLWHIDSWRDGEGEDLWRADRDAYDTSALVRPRRVGDGLVLGTTGITTQLTAAGGNFGDGDLLAVAHQKLYAMENGAIAEWDPSASDWTALTANTNTAQDTRMASLTESGTDLIFVGKVGGLLEKYDVGADSWATHVGTASWTAQETVPIVFEGVLYALNNTDLYTVDSSVTNTVNKVYDEVLPAVEFRDTRWHHTCVGTSNLGPIWAMRYDDGVSRIHQYNHFTQTHSVVAELPPNSWPYSILHGFGITFVGYRQAITHTAEGEAYLFYVAQGVPGVAGPIREIGSDTASRSVMIAGFAGDDLIVDWYNRIFAYNLTSGGLSHWGTHTQAGPGEGALMFGKDAFVSGITSGGNETVERFIFDSYTTTGSLDSGRFDMGFPGSDKLLNKVVVTFDPLPTNTTIQLAYAVEGGSFTTHADTVTGDDTTTAHTFAISDSSSSVIGRDFELRIILNSTDTTKTPTIRSITAEAMSAENRLEWELEVDAGQAEDGERATPAALADLDTIAATNTIVAFSDPWQKDDYSTAASHSVRVLAVETVEANSESLAFGRVILREV